MVIGCAFSSEEINRQPNSSKIMGNFGGHALPGSFFIVFSLWWTIQMFNRYYASLRKNTKFTSTPTYPCTCLCGRFKDFPIESIGKILLVVVGLSLEIYTGYNFSVHKFTTPGNAQHATMFFFFGMSGAIDFLVYLKAPIPKDLDYVIVLIALSVEALLFHFHLHGRNELNVQLHTLLIYTIVFNLIGVILEMKYRHNVLAALSRAFFFLVQGTWFWQIGFILYNPNPYAEKWKPDDHVELTFVTMYFTWHCGINFLIMLAIGSCVAFYQKRFHTNREDDISMKRLIHTGTNGQTLISMGDSEDSDIEYQKPVVR